MCEGTDELLTAGHRDDQLTDREVLGLGALAVPAGDGDRIGMADPP